jgi:hypothetical protein
MTDNADSGALDHHDPHTSEREQIIRPGALPASACPADDELFLADIFDARYKQHFPHRFFDCGTGCGICQEDLYRICAGRYPGRCGGYRKHLIHKLLWQSHTVGSRLEI